MLDVWWPRSRRSPLARLIDVRKGYGSEAFAFRNGSMIMLASGTEASDHGDTLDLAVIDEAWAQRDATIEQALKPAMLTRPAAQLWVVSTAGNEFSAYFRARSTRAGPAARWASPAAAPTPGTRRRTTPIRATRRPGGHAC